MALTARMLHSSFSGRSARSMMTQVYDLAVIGSGIIGTCASFHGAKSGLKTIKIEQFKFGHAKGSSHGQSRIIRYAHANTAWIPIMKESYAQIDELEKKRGEKLWLNSGLLWVGGHEYVKNLSKTLSSAGCDHEVLTYSQIAARFPLFSYNDNWSGVFDPMGGTILADKWMTAFHEEYLELGGKMEEECEVKEIIKGEDVTTLKTNKGYIQAKKVIVAAGSWVNKLLPELNIKSENLALSVCYWKLHSDKDLPLIEGDQMPVFIVDDQYDGGKHYFAIPSVEYEGAIKFGEHGGDLFEAGEEPSDHDKIFVERPRRHLVEHFPKIDSSAPAVVNHCKYTMSPDEKYIIDYLEKNKNIVICAMMSGTGFKVAPGLGKALVSMVNGQPLPFDISIFKADRFEKPFKG